MECHCRHLTKHLEQSATLQTSLQFAVVSPGIRLVFSPRIVHVPMLARKQQCKTTIMSAPANRVREREPGSYVMLTAVTVLAAPNMSGHKHTYNMLLPRPFHPK